MDFNEKLNALLERCERETDQRMMREGFELLVQSAVKAGRRTYYEFFAMPGLKFVRIVADSSGTGRNGRSVHLFVEKATGNIYGSATWKQPNFKRQYGTLDTLDEWDWSGFEPMSLTGADTLVPIGERRR